MMEDSKKTVFSGHSRTDAHMNSQKLVVRIRPVARLCWHTPFISALGRHRQVDFGEFETSLVYRASSRTDSKTTQRNHVSKT